MRRSKAELRSAIPNLKFIASHRIKPLCLHLPREPVDSFRPANPRCFSWPPPSLVDLLDMSCIKDPWGSPLQKFTSRPIAKGKNKFLLQQNAHSFRRPSTKEQAAPHRETIVMSMQGSSWSGNPVLLAGMCNRPLLGNPALEPPSRTIHHRLACSSIVAELQQPSHAQRQQEALAVKITNGVPRHSSAVIWLWEARTPLFLFCWST
ncbi:hypothetical protein VTK26DRAFT_6280 [Humicola hyalothermophila]